MKKKIKEYERCIEWNFEAFNRMIKSLVEIETFGQMLLYPFFLFIVFIMYTLSYPFYILTHLFGGNRIVIYRDRYWRLK